MNKNTPTEIKLIKVLLMQLSQCPWYWLTLSGVWSWQDLNPYLSQQTKRII